PGREVRGNTLHPAPKTRVPRRSGARAQRRIRVSAGRVDRPGPLLPTPPRGGLLRPPARALRGGTASQYSLATARIKEISLAPGALGRRRAPARGGAVPPCPRGLDPPARRRGGSGGTAPALPERVPPRPRRRALPHPDRALRRGRGGAPHQGRARGAPALHG